uniref:G_PROTEIN_RECEP_F1_2 domain-containing protein n=1 Tax=Heterorhabditis bacteriophora TaxID=37862 RepID=A0A1I7XS55_HETBA
MNTRRSNVHSKLKLVWTTLLIVSSFSLSWGLCVLYFVLVCVDGCLLTYQVSLNFYLGLFLNSTVNCLVMLKLASNPFIYTLRIKAIRGSVDNLINFLCRRKTYPSMKTSKASIALLSSSSGVQNSL